MWVKLAAAAGCLAGAGAAVIILAGFSAMRGTMVRQADLRVEVAADSLGSHAVLSGLNPGPMLSGQDLDGLRVEVLGPVGQWLMPAGWSANSGPPGPRVPVSRAWLAAHAGRLVTLPARRGGQRWQAIVRPIRYRAQRVLYTYGANDFTLILHSSGGPGLPGLLVVAIDPGEAGPAAWRMAAAGVGFSLVVILAMAGLCAALVRGSLRRSLAGVLRRAEAGARPRAGPAAAAGDHEERLRRILVDSVAELREPLHIIGGFAEYYRRRGRSGTGEHDDMMRRMAAEAARMGATVDALEAAAAEPADGPGV
jgi:signal transduction histidine kinase